MINLRLAECAIALDRHRNFARAAAAVGVTQPTFSRSVAQLERNLGVRLFDRSSRRVEPTAEGRVFVARARALLADAARIRDELGDLGSLRSGELIVGVGPYPLVISVIEAVGRLVTRFPALRVHVVEDGWRNLMQRLLSGEIGIVIAEASLMTVDSRLTVEPLPIHRGVFYCRPGHALDGRRDLTRRQVLQYSLVGSQLPGRLAALFRDNPAAVTPDPMTGDLMPRIMTTSVATARALVQRSDGIGFATREILAEDLSRGTVVALDVEADLLRTQYGIARLRDRTPSPVELMFLQLQRDVEAELTVVEGKPAARARVRRTKGRRSASHARA